MGSLAKNKISSIGNRVVEIDVDEMVLRLRSISEGCNIEVMRLVILSMLDEIADAAGEHEEDD